ncbi:hypothetical protein ACMGE5_05185 [Macrococcus equi]|uniref:hypothetical protein n=1 Tax=Macrococcus equi TaxID=3395462 RepID=UPI0039BDD06E
MNGNDTIKAVTDAQGKATFNNVKSNVMYKIYVSGIEMKNAYAKSGQDVRVSVELAQLEQAKQQGVTFNAYVINNKYQYVKNQNVKLIDITSGRKVFAQKKTNQYGKASFTKLPVERNFAVYINGINQGYTIRGVEGTTLNNTFYVNKKGAYKYNVATQPAKVVVVDENAQELKNQKVDLYRGTEKVRSQKTKSNGSAQFTNKITVGTQYNIYVNNKKIANKFVRSGETTYVYLTAKEIRK